VSYALCHKFLKFGPIPVLDVSIMMMVTVQEVREFQKYRKNYDLVKCLHLITH